MSIRLGVNIDHVATVRQARGVSYPDPIQAAFKAIKGGADGITLHLREDRRHIQDADLFSLKETINVPINFEMAATEEMVAIAESLKPTYVCLVPEKREELTTEGGLDVANQIDKIKLICKRLAKLNISVSLFIDPEEKQMDAAKKTGAPIVELHTGAYAEAKTVLEMKTELKRLTESAAYAKRLRLIVNAGHGLHIENVQLIAKIPEINELNIGHSIVARALFIGMQAAVAEMKALMMAAREITVAV